MHSSSLIKIQSLSAYPTYPPRRQLRRVQSIRWILIHEEGNTWICIHSPASLPVGMKLLALLSFKFLDQLPGRVNWPDFRVAQWLPVPLVVFVFPNPHSTQKSVWDMFRIFFFFVSAMLNARYVSVLYNTWIATTPLQLDAGHIRCCTAEAAEQFRKSRLFRCFARPAYIFF